jgi:DNA (cytosine-5)-methyltransferase 1
MVIKDRKLTFIDLFAGCGGLSEGFLSSGKFDGLAHVEWETAAIDTLRRRLVTKWRHSEELALERVIQFDIQKTTEILFGNWGEESLARFAKRNSKLVAEMGLEGVVGASRVDMVIGGPPCQAYSIAGRAQDPFSMKNDYRNYLFESFLKVIERFRPKIFLFENVPGILSACPGDKRVIDRIFESFSKAGYQILRPEIMKRAIFDSHDFGVPQHRNRVFILGVEKVWAKKNRIGIEGLYDFVESRLKKTGRRGGMKTVRDAIGNLPHWLPSKELLKDGSRKLSHALQKKASNSDAMHQTRFHNLEDQGIFKEWVVGKKNLLSNDEKIAFYNERKNKNSKHGKYRSLEWGQPSPTIVAHLHKDGLMFIHPDPKQARSITVREAALLQSFPKDYVFLGSMGAQYKMVGNAVPPRMAKLFAQALAEILTDPQILTKKVNTVGRKRA